MRWLVVIQNCALVGCDTNNKDACIKIVYLLLYYCEEQQSQSLTETNKEVKERAQSLKILHSKRNTTEPQDRVPGHRVRLDMLGT